MKLRRDKTPDQIRRETVPVKHNGLVYGFLGGVLGATLCFGGWGLFHPEQVRRFPEYCAYAIKAKMGGLSLFGATPKRNTGMSAAQLRFGLMRFGNEDHRYDREIIRHGWYPKEASPVSWVYEKGAVQPIYSDSPALVFKWPMTLSLFTFLGALVWGLAVDSKYRAAIIAGIPFDGSVVTTVRAYNAEVKGDGMGYAVKPWKDR